MTPKPKMKPKSKPKGVGHQAVKGLTSAPSGAQAKPTKPTDPILGLKDALKADEVMRLAMQVAASGGGQ